MRLAVFWIFYLCVLCCSLSAVASSTGAEVRLPVASIELDWFDARRQRPVKVTVWYSVGSALPDQAWAGCARNCVCIRRLI